MRRLPTDLKILNVIYNRYYDTFSQYTKGDQSRSTKIHVPIDIDHIASDLKVDRDIVFGRLYYDLQKKHGYRKDDGALVPFFDLRNGNEIHTVNFPLMASVLANLRYEHKKFSIATVLALVALIVSIFALANSCSGQPKDQRVFSEPLPSTPSETSAP